MDIVEIGTYAMDVMMKVDKLPGEDGFAVVTDNVYTPGGSGTNVISQAARLGASCGFMGLLADDSIGRDIIKSLEEEKIDTSRIKTKNGGVSLHTDIVVDAEGKKFILLNMGDSFLAYSENDVDETYIKSANVYYTDLLPVGPAVKGLKAAKESGLKTGFNMQVELPSMNGFGASKEAILDSLKYVDLFAPCREGLYQICETRDVDECEKYIRKFFTGTLVVTLGSKGSVGYLPDGTKVTVPAREVKTVDTTGAGDSYMGAMLYTYLLNGWDLEKSMKFATVCSSETCTKLGARSGPSIEEVEKIFNGQ